MDEEALFHLALTKPAAELEAFLDEACGSDAVLRKRIRSLLAAHKTPNLLGKPALEQYPEILGRGCGNGGDDAAGAAPGARGQTHRDLHPADELLAFLAPSEKAGSLGRLDHYEVLQVAGHGGMGVVLKAFDEKLHRVVAIKMLTPQLALSGSSRKRFVREAQAAAAVSHEHVIAIHAVEDGGPLPYLVMAYIDGISLEERISQGGALELKEILRIGIQTSEGLAAAHRQGLVHRDIKPANILLENGVQRVKITDFGLARAVDDASLTESGMVAGTPMYMSPEQASAEHVDHRSDLFSLGSVLYALCTGRPPFRAATAMGVLKRVCEDAPPRIEEINPEIPAWLGGIVGKLHAKTRQRGSRVRRNWRSC